jgi:hypothetical protein
MPRPERPSGKEAERFLRRLLRAIRPDWIAAGAARCARDIFAPKKALRSRSRRSSAAWSR